jgi:SAM-dependent methyltransferase
MNETSCPLCRENSVILGPRRTHKCLDVEYSLFHCTSCEGVFWLPPVFPDEKFYEEQQFGTYALSHSLGHLKLPGHQEGFFKHFPLRRGRLLDIGCSDGIFLQYAEKVGFQVHGIDIDSVAIKRAMNVTQNVWAMGLDEFVSYSRTNRLQFDVITFFEVLEHQPNPCHFIENIREILAPSGWVAGSVPNRNRLFASGRSRFEHYWDLPPHHFQWFSKGSLDGFLRRSGYTDLTIVERMYGYKTEELLHQIGGLVKAKVAGRDQVQEIELQRLVTVMPTLSTRKKFLLLGLRTAKNVVKLPFKALEITLERFFGTGPSLYFQARVR